ncbi:hypothetical protein EON63_18265 [archaeon]|nr:MAG: hypothetical protein EON63_18265 [archaeon]
MHCRAEAKSSKAQKEITTEIQAIMRQITASVTFLPLLQEACCFDLLVYADKEATVPLLWEDSDPCLISNAENVKLRSFNTKVCVCMCTCMIWVIRCMCLNVCVCCMGMMCMVCIG